MVVKREPYGFRDSYFRYLRAREHLADLRRLIDAFKSDPQAIGEYVEPQTVDDLLKTTNREIRQASIPDVIPIRIGELAYNLRCALDYLVFALAWHDTGVEPTGQWAKRLQFPVENNPKFFEGRRASLLKGVSEPHVAMIRRYQPCNGCDWTRRLADLNDSDKHRHLVVLAGSFDRTTDTTEWVTNAAEIQALWERGIFGSHEMDVEIRASLDIVFPDGELVSETLEELESEVGSLLLRFGREFTLRPI